MCNQVMNLSDVGIFSNWAAEEGLFRRAIIAPDLTASERQHDKEFRGEVRERRVKGQEGWFIRNG